jgi:hypothetical protein
VERPSCARASSSPSAVTLIEGSSTTEHLARIFSAAHSFGLDGEEIWQVVNEVCVDQPVGTALEPAVDDLLDTLTVRILSG